MISHLRLDIRGAVRLYHAALALSPQDAIVTVLLEMALKEAGAMDVTSMPGIPYELRDGVFDPARLVRKMIAGGSASVAGPSGSASGKGLGMDGDSVSLAEADEGEGEGEGGMLSPLPEREDSVRLTRGRGGRTSRSAPLSGGSGAGGYAQNGHASGTVPGTATATARSSRASASSSRSPKKRGMRASTEERRTTRSMSRGVELGTPGVQEVSMEDETMDIED